ncbi:MAG: hypothetical protein A3B38_00705 [Candidatus Levybacteria bacterium RIFCSPLOWO2_01_FULL_36_13]|nr:MAG: hypothetical protein A2684_01945 [Candidatus Levybacteria bacterium RIFCSPHIGHO2_01_FULL_36_15b]OGH35408.1 MAG: hypothetical protein A3B38_00705 [Candidatus Levybacteria bacterium RIFCSPLOWO2_01_FULL_36_13]
MNLESRIKKFARGDTTGRASDSAQRVISERNIRVSTGGRESWGRTPSKIKLTRRAVFHYVKS